MPPNKPILVGITGGIGSGKTVVCNIFKILGIQVYDADARAKQLMISDASLVASIKQNFGKEIYLEDVQLDRVQLANQVFVNKEKLEMLNKLVHPAIAQDFEKWVKIHEDQTYLIKEAALLVEAGSYKSLDYLITVTAPLSLRIHRIQSRDPHRTRENIEAIISKQLGDEQKIAKSQFVIKNDEQSRLIPQVLEIHEKLISFKRAG